MCNSNNSVTESALWVGVVFSGILFSLHIFKLRKDVFQLKRSQNVNLIY